MNTSETGSSTKTRLYEYQHYLETGLPTNSAVAEHQHSTGNRIHPESMFVPARVIVYFLWDIIEALEFSIQAAYSR